MTFRQAKQVAAFKFIPTALDGSEIARYVGEFVVPAGLAATDIIEMGGLPAGHIPTSVKIAWPSIDSGSTITCDVGILSGTFGDAKQTAGARTMGNEFNAADTTARAGGVSVIAKYAGLALAVAEVDRGIGIKIVGAIGTLVTGGVIRMIAEYTPAPIGM